MSDQKSISDVLITLIIAGMPVLSGVLGIFLGKWLEGRGEHERLRRDVYLKANRALSRYTHFYMGIAPYPSGNAVEELRRETSLLQEAKADIEVFGSDAANRSLADCLRSAVKCGQEAAQLSQKGEVLTKPDEQIPSFEEFLSKRKSWNAVVRKDLGLL